MTSTHCASGSASEPHGDDPGELRAELRVRPRRPASCPLGAREGSKEVAAHDLVCEGGDCAVGCECRATVETDEGMRLVGKRIEEDCVCPVFRSYDCVASIEAVENGELVVAVSLSSRQVLTDVVADLRDRGATVELRSISEVGRTRNPRQLRIDASSVTAKQREAIEAAIESGYYETPREADLSDLADQLGVSRSAVSQRLTAAETTLVGALYDLESETRER